MREILFRGKRKDNNEFVQGFYFNELYAGKHFIKSWYYGSYAELQTFEVIPETVGQYTGLTDKNGNKIFEGDIVKVTDDYGETNQCSCGIGYVLFYDGVWYIDNEVNDGLYDVNKIYYVEVIGNIHDNPELLGGAEND